VSKEDKTSILITTHYIEECRRAHAIALMRNGKILVENSPHILLTHFLTDNLEDVFLKVCRAADEKLKDVVMPPNLAQTRDSEAIQSTGALQAVTTGRQQPTPTKGSVDTKNSPNPMKRFGALFEKNFLDLWRQKM